MCGICGIAGVDPGDPVEIAVLARMTGILRHRGPDSDGLHAGPGIGLGVRRLAVIDLATGDQPIASEDGTVVIVCNGEIYNHRDLRAQLVAAGHRFRTASDVEVIVHLYEEHGADCVTYLRGMFAFALWDARARKLLLARDRLGIKPLHYAITAQGLVFGSESKAILASGMCAPEVDRQALRQMFSYGRIVGPRTIVTGIHRLQAGHCLAWHDGEARVRPYWDVRFPAHHDYNRTLSAGDWALALRTKLEESVRLHLISDVPVGAWLSAGIDSSAVTALMAGMREEAVPTFTLRFEDPRFDELGHQRGLDDYPQYRLAGHRLMCRVADLERLPKAVWHGEDALLGGVLVGQLMVAEAAAREVKVVLTGEGADEILGGYSWYPTQRMLQPVFALPACVRRAIAGMPPVRRRWPGAASVIAGSPTMDFERYARSITHLRGQAMDEAILSADLLDRLRAAGTVEDAPPTPAGFETWHPFAQMQYWDIKHRLADTVVQALDRASMAYSVEARVPFLDHELVEFCARIPPWVKMHWLREKAVLRRAMRGVLPPDIRARRKRPLQVPTDVWLRGPLPEFAETLLSERALRETGYFDPAHVAELRRRHREGPENLGQALSAALNVQVWDDLYRRRHLAASPA